MRDQGDPVAVQEVFPRELFRHLLYLRPPLGTDIGVYLRRDVKQLYAPPDVGAAGEGKPREGG